MESFAFVFTGLLLLVGLLLVLHVKGTLWATPPPEAGRDQQLAAYEERRMRVRRDRVWWKIEELHSEFAEREAALADSDAAGASAWARSPAPRPEQAGDSGAFTPRESETADA